MPRVETEELAVIVDQLYELVGSVTDDRLESQERIEAARKLGEAVKALPDVLLPQNKRLILALDIETAVSRERANNDPSEPFRL